MTVLTAILTACGSDASQAHLGYTDASGTSAALQDAEVTGVITVSVEPAGTVASVSFYVDADPSDGSAAVTLDEAPFTFELDTTDLHDGRHRIVAEAMRRGARGKTSILLDADFVVINGEPDVNVAPTVDAGEDASIRLGDGTTLQGSVADDGRPDGTVTHRWSLASGPGTATFDDPALLTTDVHFSSAGAYVLTLFASDGSLSASDVVTIDVAPPDDPEPTEPTPPDDATCLPEDGATLVLTSRYDEEYQNRDGLADGTSIDATAAQFLAIYDSSDDDPVTVMNAADLCWSGGLIDNGIPDDVDDWEAYHGAQGMYFRDVPGLTVERVSIHRTGDGIRIQENSQDFTIRDSYFQHTGDDAIENDILQSGRIEDNLFDWTYVFYSSRLASKDEGRYDGRDDVVEITGNLVALRPQVAVYDGPSPGHGGFFKMDSDGVGTRLVLRDNVFLATQLPNHTGLDLTAGGAVVEAQGNVIVWLGDTEYPDPLPDGWTLTRDLSVWTEARDAWIARHPGAILRP